MSVDLTTCDGSAAARRGATAHVSFPLAGMSQNYSVRSSPPRFVPPANHGGHDMVSACRDSRRRLISEATIWSPHVFPSWRLWVCRRRVPRNYPHSFPERQRVPREHEKGRITKTLLPPFAKWRRETRLARLKRMKWSTRKIERLDGK